VLINDFIKKVDEIFGQVSQPSYTVRFPSEDKIDKERVKPGTLIFAVMNYAKFVDMKEAMVKGSDASAEFDEEPDPNSIEYSDDEEEARAKKQRRESKQTKEGQGKQRNERNERSERNGRGGGRGGNGNMQRGRDRNNNINGEFTHSLRTQQFIQQHPFTQQKGTAANPHVMRQGKQDGLLPLEFAQMAQNSQQNIPQSSFPTATATATSTSVPSQPSQPSSSKIQSETHKSSQQIVFTSYHLFLPFTFPFTAIISSFKFVHCCSACTSN